VKLVVAVDVGGTAIKGAVVRADGVVLQHIETPTPVDAGPDEVVRAVRAVTARLVAGAGATDGRTVADVAAVGLVVPGTVDAAAGVARWSANIGWRDVPLRDLVAQDTGLTTVLDHDVRAAGVAERELGLTRGVDDSLLVVIGTGIAGVLSVDGRVVLGATGVAGEIGHLPIWPDGDECPCGQTGCLERYASAASISRRYREATGDLAGEVAGAREIAAMRSTDAVASRVWDQAIEALAIGLAAATMMLDPALIVVGGGLSAAGEPLLEPLRAGLARRIRWRPPPPVELSPLGPRAGLLGAAILAGQAAGLADFSGWGASGFPSDPLDG
jgi:glucokinase